MDNLVICAGVEHTGSTSLWYTLRENKIVHTGHFKQSKYLQAYEKKDSTIRSFFNQKRKMPFQPKTWDMQLFKNYQSYLVNK